MIEPDAMLLRLGLLALFVAGMLLLDLRNPPGERHRSRAYGFLLGAGLVGTAVGLLTDAVTIRISPEYYEFGKGIERGEGFIPRGLLLGSYAGFAAGVVLGGILLLLHPRWRAEGAPWREIRVPLMGGIGCGIVMGLAMMLAGPDPWYGDPLDLVSVPSVFREGEIRRMFYTAWGSHLGVYVGGIAGTILVCIRIRRRFSPPPQILPS